MHFLYNNKNRFDFLFIYFVINIYDIGEKISDNLDICTYRYEYLSTHKGILICLQPIAVLVAVSGSDFFVL